MLQRLSLRARLLLGVIAIAAVGLVAADLATYKALESFLLDRVESSLNAVHPGVEAALFGRPGQGGPGPGGARGGGGDLRCLFTSIPGDCIEVRRLNQAVVGSACIPQFGQSESAPGPKLPKTISAARDPNTAQTATASPSSPSRR